MDGLAAITDFPTYSVPAEQEAADYIWRQGGSPLLLMHGAGGIPEALRGAPALYLFDSDCRASPHISTPIPDSVSIVASIGCVNHAEPFDAAACLDKDLMGSQTICYRLTPRVGSVVSYWRLDGEAPEHVRSSRFGGGHSYDVYAHHLFMSIDALPALEERMGFPWPDQW